MMTQFHCNKNEGWHEKENHREWSQELEHILLSGYSYLYGVIKEVKQYKIPVPLSFYCFICDAKCLTLQLID